jgi:hypothetical protein
MAALPEGRVMEKPFLIKKRNDWNEVMRVFVYAALET